MFPDNFGCVLVCLIHLKPKLTSFINNTTTNLQCIHFLLFKSCKHAKQDGCKKGFNETSSALDLVRKYKFFTEQTEGFMQPVNFTPGYKAMKQFGDLSECLTVLETYCNNQI